MELRPSSDFKPLLITVPRFIFHQFLAYQKSKSNEEAESYVAFSARSNIEIPNVFVVLELRNVNSTRLVIEHIGQIDRHMDLPYSFEIPKSKSREELLEIPSLHFFSEGIEIPSTHMHWLAVKKWFDQSVSRQISQRPPSTKPPTLLISPMIKFPSALYSTKESGSARILMSIDQKGLISESKILEASHPEFGEAATQHLRYWRFVPKLQNGIPTSSKVIIPFNFSPPKPSEISLESEFFPDESNTPSELENN